MADVPDSDSSSLPADGHDLPAAQALARGLVRVVPDPPDLAGRDPFAIRHPGLKRFRARWFALLGAIVIALYLCWLMLEPFLGVLLWATVLAIVFYPVHVELVRRSRNAGVAAAISCVLVMTVILAPLVLVSIAVVNETQGAVGRAAAYVKETNGVLFDPGSRVYQFFFERNVDLNTLVSVKTVVAKLQEVGADLAGQTLTAGVAGLMIVLKIVFVVLTLYYLFRDGERLKNALLDGLPLERSQTQRIFERTREVIGASIYGVLVIASIQAILGGIAFHALGLPSPLLWTVVMFFLSMIPMAGSFIVWVPAAIYLVATGHWVKAIVLSAWCIGIIGMLDNVLRPRLVGKRTRLHELLVFFSVLGGLKVFGPLGLVIGPVVVAITLALVDIFRKAERPANPAEPTLAERQAQLRNVPREEDKPTGEEIADAVVAAIGVGPPVPAAPLSRSDRRKAKRAGRT